MFTVDEKVFRGGLVLVAFSLLSWVVYRLTRPLLRRITPTSSGMVSNLLRYGVVILGLFFSLREARASNAQIWTIIAIFSASMALALESTARDVLNGMKLLVFSLYRTGDIVSIDDRVGEVIEITDSFTCLKERFTSSIVYIRNSDVVESVVVNHSRYPLETLRLFIPVRSDISKVAQTTHLLKLAVQSYPRFEKSPIEVFFSVTGGEGLFEVRVPDVEKKARDVWLSSLYTSTVETLSRAGIRIEGHHDRG